MKELDLQKRIIDEVKAAGGWGRKWASSWQNGVPDLILILPGGTTVFAEVKLVERVSFNFTTAPVKTTRLQRQEMARIVDAGGIALVLIGMTTPEGGRLYAVPHYAETFMSTDLNTRWHPRRIVLNAPALIWEFERAEFSVRDYDE